MAPIPAKDDTTNYYNLATKQYEQRVDFLKAYCNRHNVQDCFKRLALSEMHSLYISNLIVPGYSDEDIKSGSARFSDNYLKTILEEPYTDERLYFNTALYAYATSDYWGYIAARDNSASLRQSNATFTSKYKLIKENCSNKTREHLLGYLLKSSAGAGHAGYDSLLQDYNSICNDKILLAQVNDAAEKEKEKVRKISEITFEQALATEVEDAHGKKHTLKDALDKKKFTVIDCWASWCSPCLGQMPYTKKMEQKYGKDFTFIFLSFDRNQNDWTAKSKQLKITENTYLLAEGFKSNLAYHFGIASIPRFLIFDSHGNIVNANASRPSKPEFQETLDSLIKENKMVSRVK
jgi:thiol-disulfide isomerase/thioredoxin